MVSGKKILKWSSISIALFAAVIITAAIAIKAILTPENLNRLVEEYSSELLNAQVKTDTIELHLFRNFPRITLSIKNGEIISHALDSLKSNPELRIPAKADTLLKFKSFDITLSLIGLLNSDISIRRAGIVSPQLFAYVAPDGTANYDIFKDSGSSDPAATDSTTADTNAADSTAAETAALPVSVSLNSLSIRDKGSVTYMSSPDSLMARIALNRLMLRGNISTDLDKMELKRARLSRFSIGVSKRSTQNDTLHKAFARFVLDSLDISSKQRGHYNIAAISHSDIRMDETVLAKNFPFEVNGGIIFDTTQALCGTLDNFTLSVAKVPVTFNGTFNVCPDSLYTNNICGKIENMNIAELLKYVPEEIMPEIEKINTNAALSLDVDINGSYKFKTGELPSVYAKLDIPKSFVEFKGQTSRINELEAHLKGYYSATCKDSAALEINKFVVNGRGIQMVLDGKVSDLASADPHININFKGGANLDTLSTLFPAKEGSFFTGTANADLRVKSRVSNLNLYQIGKADIKGALTTDKIRVAMPSQEIFAVLSGIDIKLGSTSNTRDESIQKGMKMLATSSKADSVFFRYKDEMMVAAKMLHLIGHHTAEGLVQNAEQKKVLPANGTLSAQSLYVRGVDSASLRMTDPKIKFSILPYENDYTIPSLSLNANVARLFARDLVNRVSLTNGNFNVGAILNNKENKERKARMNRMLDSLQNIYPEVERDSLMKHHMGNMRAGTRKQDDFSESDMSFQVDRSIGAIIRQWNISGAITADRSRITTPYFPLRSKLENINLNFTTDKIEFKDTKFTAGHSMLNLTGKAVGLKNAMLRNSPVTINGVITSDTLNFNELLVAANKGMEFMSAGEAVKDSLATITDEEALQEQIEIAGTDSLSNPLIIIPKNIRADLKLNVKYGVYSKLELNKVAGELIVKDRCLQVKGFEALTNAGDMELSAFYSTRSKQDLSTGFDLELKDVAIEKLVELMPAVDTLLPMLKSFSGLVNCQLAATSKIDTLMNIELPTLRGVARITGEDLVLMDGETFATIAKKLKFKNKEKNYIDRISVELLLNDNRIEVFPFIAQMDRYKFAISGTQNLDMSFNYNISILESPIPFRVGVKIFGDVEDFGFKIGKAQYKSDKLPVFSTLIDSTRLNFREQIANIYRIGVDAALKNGTSIEKLQRRKNDHDATYTKQLDTLSKEEALQYEAIEPAPAPAPAEAPAEAAAATPADTLSANADNR